MILNTKTNMKLRCERHFLWLVMLLLAGSTTAYAQSDCFTYEDDDKTIIDGLTSKGQAATSLEIPKEVTTVRSGAFDYAFSEDQVSELVIEAGGNPTFEANLFGTTEVSTDVYEPNANRLSDIQILGNSMTVANITALFTSLVAKGALSTVYIEGYSGAWSNIGVTDVLTDAVTVVLPAALVTTQQFGNATVYGRFEITKEIITFCGNVTFRDTDSGSNMLFYVANYKDVDGRLHIQRVKYIAKDEGVLIHNLKNTSSYADLERISTDKYTGTDASLYDSNKLVGVTTPTKIESTDGDKTNYILKDGAFHPTTGGTVKANKAYLQIPTAAAREDALTIEFDEDGTTEVRTTDFTDYTDSGAIYDLQGRKLVGKPTTKGLYIHGGKKVSIK